MTTDDKFAEAMVYAFTNMCTHLKLNRKETIDVINAVLLGHSSKNPVDTKIRMEDITRINADKNE